MRGWPVSHHDEGSLRHGGQTGRLASTGDLKGNHMRRQKGRISNLRQLRESRGLDRWSFQEENLLVTHQGAAAPCNDTCCRIIAIKGRAVSNFDMGQALCSCAAGHHCRQRLRSSRSRAALPIPIF